MWTRKEAEEMPESDAAKEAFAEEAAGEDALGDLPATTGRSVVTFKPAIGEVRFNEFMNFVRRNLPSDRDVPGMRTELVSAEPKYWSRYGVAVVPAAPEDLRAMPLDEFGVATITAERYFRARVRPEPEKAGDNAWAFNATRVEASRRTGAGIRVAILDTGIATMHPAFHKRIADSASFVIGLTVEDGFGHGTHIAGIACGALPPAGDPRFGVAHGAEILVARVMTDDGLCVNASIINGIEWAQNKNADIIVMAIGGSVGIGDRFDDGMEIVAQQALKDGVLLMAMTGNDMSRSVVDPVNDPANCLSIMAVGSVGPDRAAASTLTAPALASLFSCGQVNIDGEVNVVAPGENILSAWLPDTTAVHSGTSQAVAFAAGVAALWAEETGLRGIDLWLKLEQSALKFSTDVMKNGHGLVQAP